jgi:membrane fusion protein, multidrug efflux system
MNRVLWILALPLVLGACARSRADIRPADQPVPVRVAPVAVAHMAPPITATGTLGPKEEVSLAFKVGGVVARVMADEGQVVRQGQVLAALDLGGIDPGVARAQSAADKARRDLARARRLYADSVVTLSQVEDAETGRDVANAELETVTFDRRHAVIVAPAAGVILRRHVEPGELVQAGTPVLTLGSAARGQVVRAGLADRDVVRIRRGDAAVVRFDALPGQAFQGTVTEVAAAADPATGTWRVEVSLPGAPRLASGLVGALQIQPGASRPLTLVPVTALLEADGATATVFTLSRDGRHAERRAIAIAFVTGDQVAVAAGLEGAGAVITDGAAYLDDGGAVEVRP